MGEVTGKAWADYSEPRIMAADLEAIEAAIVRNTGLLDAKSLLAEGCTATFLYIQRQGPIVTLQAYKLQGPAGVILTLPTGFNPSTVGAVNLTWSGGAKIRYSNTELISQEEGLVVGSSAFEMLQFLTNDGWPTAHGLPIQNPPVYN